MRITKMNAQRMMKVGVLAAAVGSAVSSGSLMADTNDASQTVSYQVDEIALISVSADPSLLKITTTANDLAGGVPLDVTDTTTTWATTSNAGTDAKKVTAVLGGNMPAHTELSVELGAPTGGLSAGSKSLNTRSEGTALTVQDVVTGIDPVAQSGMGVTYTFSADVEAGIVGNANATVTFTLNDHLTFVLIQGPARIPARGLATARADAAA